MENITFNVTIRTSESDRRKMARFTFMFVNLLCGAIISHLIAGSWIIEMTFVVFAFVTSFMIFDYNRQITDTRISMTADQLRQWLDAGCPKRWPLPKIMSDKSWGPGGLE